MEQFSTTKMRTPTPIFDNLEVGEITPAEFRSGVRKLLQNEQLTDVQIDEAWCTMLLDIPVHRLKKVQELSQNYNLYLFSNTNQIHINRLLSEFKEQYDFDFPSLFTAVYYSHEIHDSKPENQFVRKGNCTVRNKS